MGKESQKESERISKKQADSVQMPLPNKKERQKIKDQNVKNKIEYI